MIPNRRWTGGGPYNGYLYRNAAGGKRLLVYAAIGILFLYMLLLWHRAATRSFELRVTDQRDVIDYVASAESDLAKRIETDSGSKPMPDFDSQETIKAFSKNSDSLKEWSEQGAHAWPNGVFFHVAPNGLRIEGALTVRRSSIKTRYSPPNSLFDFDNTTRWREDTSAICHHWEFPYQRPHVYYKSCVWCPTSHRKGFDEGSCRVGKLTASIKIPDDKWTMYGEQNNLAQARSFSAESVEASKDVAAARDGHVVPATYQAVHVECTFPSDASLHVPVISGTLSLRDDPDFADFHASVAASPAQRGGREDVVCGRALFGDASATAVTRFTEFYTNRWKFHRVVLYSIGMDRGLTKDHPELKELVASGRLALVDLRDEMQRLYGSLASDAALFSAQMMQLVLRMECQARAVSFGARWAFFPDIDEFLVPSGTDEVDLLGVDAAKSRFPDLDALTRLHPDKVWFSFSQLDVRNDRDSPDSVCTCESHQSLRQYFKAVAELHQEELRLAPKPPGPFKHLFNKITSASGRRKLMLRLDRPPRAYTVGLHKIGPCAYRPLNRTSMSGVDLDPWKALYIRHYPCLNSFDLHRHCDAPTRHTGVDAWWRGDERVRNASIEA